MKRYVTVRIEITQDDGRPPTSVQACSQTYPRGTEKVGNDSESEIIGKTFLAAMHGISDFVGGGGYELDALAAGLTLLSSCEYTGHDTNAGAEANRLMDAAWDYDRKRDAIREQLAKGGGK
jgi:hypothetical protein